MRHSYLALIALTAIATASCSDDKPTPKPDTKDELADEYYAGGRLGTTFNTSATAFSDPTPAVEEAGMTDRFKYGELFFERTCNQSTKPFNGLGPLYVRSSCMSCHPGYGHGKRMDRYRANDWGNGYLLVLTDRNDNYLSSLTGMPQTKAVEPFKAPLDEEKIVIKWLPYTDEWNNTFPDGETYSLIYPEVTIPEDAFYVPLEVNNQPIAYSDLVVRLESTIGIYGTGLLDAIDDDDLKAQYALEEKAGARINPAIFKNGEWTSLYGKTTHPKRFTYALSRGPLQDAAGANAIWNITNVTHSDRRYHYMTATYARTAAADPDVQAKFYAFFPEWNKTGNVSDDIYNYLMNKELPAEMTDNDYVDFMIWHRGLAVPAARDLDDAQVKQGRELFTQIGCATCHRPTWTTGEDKFTDPNGFFKDADARLPRYPNQKIWPYTDMVQHRLEMVNNIRTGWCRTTPLWGRGLSAVCSGHSDRLHDCRARNTLEAIMWHGAANSDARASVENFRKLSKSERDAVVRFIDSI